MAESGACEVAKRALLQLGVGGARPSSRARTASTGEVGGWGRGQWVRGSGIGLRQGRIPCSATSGPSRKCWACSCVSTSGRFAS